MPSRKFTAEGPNLYGRFLRGSCQWAELSDAGDLGEVYDGGYLPWSGDTADPRHLFYRARSLRADLDQLSLSKSRRYDHRRWQAYSLQRQLVTKAEFLRHGRDRLTELAYQWMEPRFGDQSLARERFDYILDKPYLRHLLTWRDKNELCAFALLVDGSWGAHYWYVFYKNGTGASTPPGHGYLVDFLYWAKANHLRHAYLGTTYGTKSRYKCRGIRGIEFWDGERWNASKTDLAACWASDMNQPASS